MYSGLTSIFHFTVPPSIYLTGEVYIYKQGKFNDDSANWKMMNGLNQCLNLSGFSEVLTSIWPILENQATNLFIYSTNPVATENWCYLLLNFYSIIKKDENLYGVTRGINYASMHW